MLDSYRNINNECILYNVGHYTGFTTEVCRAPTPTPTQTGLDSTTPNIGAGVAIGRGWSLDGAEFKAYYPVTRQFVLVLYVDCTALNLTLKSLTMSIEFIYIMPLLVNDRVETTLI